jgi:hypothetical protein
MATAVAIVAAIIAWIAVLWVQRPNLVESVRPEIVLKDWTQGEPNCLRFTKIKNVGRGTAFNLHVSCDTKSKPTQALLTGVPNFLLVEANQELDVQGEIKLFWDSVEPKEDQKYLHFDIVILWWDSINQRHLVRQSVMVDYTTVKMASMVGLPDEAMPHGVNFGPRARYTESVWWLKRKDTLRRVPGLARFLPSRY